MCVSVLANSYAMENQVSKVDEKKKERKKEREVEYWAQ